MYVNIKKSIENKSLPKTPLSLKLNR